MNKYVVRTSLVWVAIIVSAVAFYLYRDYKPKHRVVRSSEVEPVSAGPAASPGNEKKLSTNTAPKHP
ncbi:MAG: hypothetical protein ACR2JB_29920 [Bryobacteraceae bacterium]